MTFKKIVIEKDDFIIKEKCLLCSPLTASFVIIKSSQQSDGEMCLVNRNNDF